MRIVPCLLPAVALVVSLVSPIASAAAQEPAAAARPAVAQPPAGPEEVVRKTLEAMRGHDFQGLAQQAHPAALADLRQKLRPLVVADSTHELSKLLFGVDSLEKFDALGDRGLFVAVMTKLASFGSSPSSDARFTVLGSVPEPPDQVHVIYRAAYTGDSGAASSSVNLMTVQKDHEEWKAVLTDNINEMAGKLLEVLQSATAAKP